jgi:hypothetical protein
MRTEHVVVIAVYSGLSLPPNGLDEVVGGACQLARRYGGYVIHLDTTAIPSASNWERYIGQDARIGIDTNYIASISKSDDIGVYIVSHGGKGKVGNITAEQWAQLLVKMNFTKIRKLCVVACNSAQESVDGLFIRDLCSALAPYGLAPKIAGWSGFVSIAFDDMVCNPQIKESATKSYKRKEQGIISDERFRNMAANGQKYIKARNYASMSSINGDSKEKIKVVYQWDGSTPRVLSLTEWSDRTRT